jgi:hypothetical protein
VSIKLFLITGILLFERIFHQTKCNMIHAIARCSFDSPSLQLPDISSCTLQEACSAIEINSALNELKDTLISKIETYFYCHSCYKTSDHLKLSNIQIFIFNLTVKNEIIAHPVIYKDNEDSANDDRFCTYCKVSSKDIVLSVYKQIFLKCPLVLMVSLTIITLLLFSLHN